MSLRFHDPSSHASEQVSPLLPYPCLLPPPPFPLPLRLFHEIISVVHLQPDSLARSGACLPSFPSLFLGAAYALPCPALPRIASLAVSGFLLTCSKLSLSGEIPPRNRSASLTWVPYTHERGEGSERGASPRLLRPACDGFYLPEW